MARSKGAPSRVAETGRPMLAAPLIRSGATAPVAACPVPTADLNGETPSSLPSAVPLPASFTLPPGAQLYGAALPSSPSYIVAPSGFSCVASYAAATAGGGSAVASGAAGSQEEVEAIFSPGNNEQAEEPIACPYILAVAVAMQSQGLSCGGHPANETITPLTVGASAAGSPISGAYITLVQAPPGTVDANIGASGSADPTDALFTALVSDANGTAGAGVVDASCTLPVSEQQICAASLGFFLYESNVANGTPDGEAANVGQAVAELDALLAAGPHVPWSSSLPTPGEAFSNKAVVITSALLAVGGTIFITFPAQLFNLTFEENYAAIEGWFEERRRRMRAFLDHPGRGGEGAGSGTTPDDATVSAEAHAGSPGKSHIQAQSTAEPAANGASDRSAALAEHEVPGARRKLILVIAAGALLGSLLDPSFGANWGSLVHYIAVALALTAGLAVASAALHLYRRKRKWETPMHLHALPLGLVVAAACVIVSRLVDFQPGYLYGVVCGVALTRKMTSDEEGHVAALAIVSTLLASILAWLLWIPVHAEAVLPGAFFGVTLLDDFFSALFVSGLVGAAISLLPLRFLPGHTIVRWHRCAWVALFAIAMFGVIDVLVRSPVSPGARHSPLVTTILLFVLFAGGTVVFREHFARKWRQEHKVELHGFLERAKDLLRVHTDKEVELVSMAGTGQVVLEEQTVATAAGPESAIGVTDSSVNSPPVDDGGGSATT
jgi:hypothetical protein